MSLTLDLQIGCKAPDLPGLQQIEQWAILALQDDKDSEVCVRIVDEAEISALNAQYRGKDKATNVLSFTTELPQGLEISPTPLGDIIICAPVIAQEALEQGKTLAAHWAHMLIHGMLHLQGFDHIEDSDAVAMEQLETQLLQQLSFPAPYAH